MLGLKGQEGYVSPESAQAKLQAALEESCGKVMLTKDEAKAYAMECWKNHMEDFVIVYGPEVFYLYWDYGEYKTCKDTTETVYVNAEKYNITRYKCTYKTFSEFSFGEVDEDESNVFIDEVNCQGTTIGDYMDSVIKNDEEYSDDYYLGKTIVVDKGSFNLAYAIINQILYDSNGKYTWATGLSSYLTTTDITYDGKDYTEMRMTFKMHPTVDRYLNDHDISKDDENFFEINGNDIDSAVEDIADYAAEYISSVGPQTGKNTAIRVPLIVAGYGSSYNDIRNMFIKAEEALSERLSNHDYSVSKGSSISGSAYLDGYIADRCTISVYKLTDPMMLNCFLEEADDDNVELTNEAVYEYSLEEESDEENDVDSTENLMDIVKPEKSSEECEREEEKDEESENQIDSEDIGEEEISSLIVEE